MSNKNPLLGLIMLSALTQAAARQGVGGDPLNPKNREPFPDLDEMLNGSRQKGKPIKDVESFLDQLLNRRPWSEAPEELKQEARDAIKAGELEPNCEDEACEFCNWIRRQDEWLARGAQNGTQNYGGAPSPGERFQQEYGERFNQEYVNHKSVPGILRKAAGTYEQRNPLYGDAYKRYGATMMSFFPDGFTISEPEDWNRFGLFSMIVSKMNRIASNLASGGHYDSSLDLSVYAAMLAELTGEK